METSTATSVTVGQTSRPVAVTRRRQARRPVLRRTAELLGPEVENLATAEMHSRNARRPCPLQTGEHALLRLFTGGQGCKHLFESRPIRRWSAFQFTVRSRVRSEAHFVGTIRRPFDQQRAF